MNGQSPTSDDPAFVDRLLHPRHLAFWTLLSSIAAVIGLIITLFTLDSGTSHSATHAGGIVPPPPQSTAAPHPTQAVSSSPSSAPASTDDGSSSSPTDTATVASTSSGPVISYLADQEPIGRGLDTGTQNINGDGYTHSLYALTCPSACGSPTCEYDLGRAWKRFQADIGVNDDSDEMIIIQFEVFADGRSVGGVHRLKLGQHVHLTADITGVLRLKLVITRVTTNGGQATAVWGDAELSR